MSAAIDKLTQALRVMKGEAGVAPLSEETQKVSLDKFQELVMGEFSRAKKDAEDGRTQDAKRRMDRVQHYVGDALKALDEAKDESAVELTVFKSETLPAMAMDAGMGASILDRLGKIEDALKAGHTDDDKKPEDEEDDKKKGKDADKQEDADKPEDEEEDGDKKKDKDKSEDKDKAKDKDGDKDKEKGKDEDKDKSEDAPAWPRDLNALPIGESDKSDDKPRGSVIPTLPENVQKRAQDWGKDDGAAKA